MFVVQIISPEEEGVYKNPIRLKPWDIVMLCYNVLFQNDLKFTEWLPPFFPWATNLQEAVVWCI